VCFSHVIYTNGNGYHTKNSSRLGSKIKTSNGGGGGGCSRGFGGVDGNDDMMTTVKLSEEHFQEKVL
jgi:hypothetical protein